MRIDRTKRFRKNFTLCIKRGYDAEAFKEVFDLLIQQKTLPERCRDHKLQGNRSKYRCCHIKFDWVLIYRYDYEQNAIIFDDTGTHSDLF